MGNLYSAVLQLGSKADLAAYLRARISDRMRPIPDWALPRRAEEVEVNLWAWMKLLSHPKWAADAPTIGGRTPMDALSGWSTPRRAGRARLAGAGEGLWPATLFGPFIVPGATPPAADPETKARDLLREFLTPEQRLDYLATRSFRVRGSDGRAYVVNDGNAGRKVEELDAAGKIRERWCLVGDEKVDRTRKSRDTWPVGDVLLTQKLLLESDAKEFRRLAIRVLDRKVPPLRFVRLMCYLFDNPTSTDVWNAVLRVTKTKRAKVIRVAA